MLQIIFPNKSKEEALKLRDNLCECLKGIPAFIDNDIIVNAQDVNPETKAPLNEEGDLTCVDSNEELHEHCIRLVISSDKEKDGSRCDTIFAKTRTDTF